jgi:hypothetical protein
MRRKNNPRHPSRSPQQCAQDANLAAIEMKDVWLLLTD